MKKMKGNYYGGKYLEGRNRLERLDLFEGIVIGIYGNWLISLVDKITFTRVLVLFGITLWGYQPICLVLSFAFLLLLVGFSIFRPNLVTIRSVLVLSVGHFVGNWCALYVEGFTIKNTFFLVIGTLLFCVIYICELIRVRRIRLRVRE